MQRLIAFVSALASGGLLTLGMALQKMGVPWFKVVRERYRGWGRDALLWFSGVAFMNLAPILQYIAVGSLSPDEAGAIVGVNVAFVMAFSWLLLREHPPRRAVAFCALLLAAVAAASFYKPDSLLEVAAIPVPAWSYLFFALPVALGTVVMVAYRAGGITARNAAPSFGFASGALSGFMLSVMALCRVLYGTVFLDYFSSPYGWLYAGAGIASFVFQQAAYTTGQLSSVAPAMIGTQVVWPVLFSVLAMGTRLAWPDIACYLLVAVSAFLAAKAAAPPAARKSFFNAVRSR